MKSIACLLATLHWKTNTAERQQRSSKGPPMAYTIIVAPPHQQPLSSLPRHGSLMATSLGMVAKMLQQYRPVQAIIIHTNIITSANLFIIDAIHDLISMEGYVSIPLIAITEMPSTEEHARLLARGVQHYFTEHTPKAVIDSAIIGYQKSTTKPPTQPAFHTDSRHTTTTPHSLQHTAPPTPPTIAANGGTPQVDRVTPREREILAHIGLGSTNQMIATKLCISPTTVKNHLAHVFKKLKVANRTQAAYVAKQYNLIP